MFGEDTLVVIVGHGGVTVTNVKLLWWILLALGGYLIAGSMGQVLAGAFYAQGDTVTPATVGAIGFTVGTGLKIAGLMEFGLVGVAIGATLHQLFNTVVLFTCLEIKFKTAYSTKKWILAKVSNLKVEQLQSPTSYGVGRIVPCPLCAGIDFRILASNDRYNMRIQTVGCRQCGFVMTNPMPSEDSMKEFYKHHYRHYYRKTGTPTMQYIEEFNLADRARYTANYLQQQNLFFRRARILDVGCGEGSLLKEIKQRMPSVQTVGVEPDVAFAEFARDYLQSKVYLSLAELSESGESAFDLIIVNHVLEHVENPVDLLSRLKNIIGRYGSIYVDVPDICAYRSLADLHIAHRYHFSVRTLFVTAHEADLQVADAGRHDPPYHPRSVRCVLRRECVELKLSELEQDDRDVYDRIRAINRWGWSYHLGQSFLGLGVRRLVKAFRSAYKRF
jgi:2-polyprenyl-3-methyl-5-hydroxy-6-metoxy-1,4-benzoquinol methylase